ncbi:hypothetical protein QJS04_geneDACA017389 [Acorus gramineus]|uniref:Uncharacterized protein n=1 Tax=Acorus gramineus TaxID=55184 RepID=A0AAV8ZXT5_ACOGR|nr:hypothetical protein QJS04_geneDACA017389 [Acorus gramineus]
MPKVRREKPYSIFEDSRCIINEAIALPSKENVSESFVKAGDYLRPNGRCGRNMGRPIWVHRIQRTSSGSTCGSPCGPSSVPSSGSTFGTPCGTVRFSQNNEDDPQAGVPHMEPEEVPQVWSKEVS